MKVVVTVLLLLAVGLAGCNGEPGEEGTYHQAGVQCEPMPWDGDEYGGSDEERETRLRSYYEDAGRDVVDASVHVYDVAVTAVCGAWDARVYEITIAGEFPEAEPHGWEPGRAPEDNRA